MVFPVFMKSDRPRGESTTGDIVPRAGSAVALQRLRAGLLVGFEDKYNIGSEILYYRTNNRSTEGRKERAAWSRGSDKKSPPWPRSAGTV